MHDSLIPKFISKLAELGKFSQDKKNSRKDIFKKIMDLQQWLAFDRSIQQHRCCQAFMTFLFQSYGEKYKSREGFVSGLKCKIGFASMETTKAIIEGQTVIFKKYMPHSLSFGACTQKRHQEFFDALKEYALERWGCDFDLWHEQWISNENTLQ